MEETPLIIKGLESAIARLEKIWGKPVTFVCMDKDRSIWAYEGSIKTSEDEWYRGDSRNGIDRLQELIIDAPEDYDWTTPLYVKGRDPSDFAIPESTKPLTFVSGMDVCRELTISKSAMIKAQVEAVKSLAIRLKSIMDHKHSLGHSKMLTGDDLDSVVKSAITKFEGGKL